MDHTILEEMFAFNKIADKYPPEVHKKCYELAAQFAKLANLVDRKGPDNEDKAATVKALADACRAMIQFIGGKVVVAPVKDGESDDSSPDQED